MNGVFRPLFRIESPDASTCHDCGEGNLNLAWVPSRAAPGTRLVVSCSACPAVHDLG